jgi:hypothetical protein
MASVSHVIAFVLGALVGAPLGMGVLALCMVAGGKRFTQSIIVAVDEHGHTIARKPMTPSEVAQN